MVIDFKKCAFRECCKHAKFQAHISSPKRGGEYRLGPFFLCEEHSRVDALKLLGDGGRRYWLTVTEDPQVQVAIEIQTLSGIHVGRIVSCLSNQTQLKIF